MNERNQWRITASLQSLTAFFLVLGMLLAGFGSVLFLSPGEAGAKQSSIPPSFAELAKMASPSVVYISTVKVIKGGGQPQLPFGQEDPLREFFERFFRNQIPRDYKQRGLGTGFIIDKDGYILTNNHVVEQADEIMVKLNDEREFEAKIIGRDAKTDLALIRIKDAKNITPLPLGNSDGLEVGEWVVAIGNPFGLGHTVTAGIVSAKYRQLGAGAYDNFIQTDASINPGNSGGPLLNTEGEVVGINSMIFSQSGGSVGIGFAIPINMAKDLLPQLKKGRVVRGFLGVLIQDVTPEIKEKFGLERAEGALVSDVTPGGPAEKAGIKRGDVIVGVDGQRIKEMKELPYLVASIPVGKEVDVDVIRGGKQRTIAVVIDELVEEEESVIARTSGPKFGMRVEPVTPEVARRFGLSETGGVVVTIVEPSSPADEAGLKPGDVILEMDQASIENPSDFTDKIEDYKEGDTVLFLVKRSGGTLFLTLKLEE